MTDPTIAKKLVGGDTEFSGFLTTGSGAGGDTGAAAARLLLSQIDGYPRTARLVAAPSISGTDVGRRFLSNGKSAYIDCEKLEMPHAEVLSAREWVAGWESTLRIVRDAQRSVNDALPGGCRVHVHANNSDGEHSWGAHINVLCTRNEFENIVELAQPVHMLYLASFMASAIVVTGQGQVGPNCGSAPVQYQLSQRAEHFSRLIGLSTMSPYRSFINTRDESHALTGQARLHVIAYDANRQQMATYLKIGTLQIVLTMLEAGYIDTAPLLEDPLAAVVAYSRDPLLEARARTLHGRSLTALELQFMFAEAASRFVETGACEGIVPEAENIVSRWREVLLALKAKDPAGDRLDWPLKLSIIERAMRQNSALTWESPEVRQLDHMYSSLDDRDSLYQAMERAGYVQTVVDEAETQRAVGEPPDSTRAYTRGKLLDLADPDEVVAVDWSWIRFRIKGRSYWPTYRSVFLSDPLGFTRADTGAIFEAATTLEQALDAFDRKYPPSPTRLAADPPYDYATGGTTHGVSRTN
ncbi:MAG: proteasome accessory factor PafA2 family protein [Bryobacteraceae bacterium]